MKILAALLCCVAAIATPPVMAQGKPPLPAAYHRFATEAGVPPHLLYAVATQESSRPGFSHPWPWTANIAGKAYYFETRIDLFRTLKRYLDRGKTNFDVGLMQINWHHNAKLLDNDLWKATDPYHNLAAGARFLKQLQQQHGSWQQAVARYHVGTPNTQQRRDRAIRYRNSVWAHLKRISGRFS